jgi:hypothetical protein
MGDPEKAYHYASRHLEISKETGDRMGQATAQVKKFNHFPRRFFSLNRNTHKAKEKFLTTLEKF